MPTMYAENLDVLNGIRRRLEVSAVKLEEHGEAYFGRMAREAAEQLAELFLSGQVACCKYMSAAQQIDNAVATGQALAQAVKADKPVPPAVAAPVDDMNLQSIREDYMTRQDDGREGMM